jgi:hypothetical protein
MSGFTRSLLSGLPFPCAFATVAPTIKQRPGRSQCARFSWWELVWNPVAGFLGYVANINGGNMVCEKAAGEMGEAFASGPAAAPSAIARR